MGKLISLKQKQINTLHKYFIWANRMRIFFDEILEQHLNKKIDQHKFEIEADMYMSLWYALLYVVIEGWQQLKLQDAEISKLLKSDHVALLKRYRNGVFHFQKNDNDKRFTDFFEKDKSVTWVRLLTSSFSKWFLGWYQNQ